MKTFYTYLWLRDDGTPYYAGKGLLNRAFLKRPGHVPPLDRANVVLQEWSTEEEAFAAEVFLIAYYGRKDNYTGVLTNHTDGGEGFTGARHSEEVRQGMCRRMLGNTRALGNVLSEDTRRRMGDSRRGKPRPPGVMDNARAACAGRVVSEETRKKIGAAGLGRKASAETRTKMSKASSGRTFSEEHRKALSEAAFRRYGK